MAYIENPFSAGQSVVCVQDVFPLVITTGDKSRIGTLPPVCPKKGEVYVIDEILGEFLRFAPLDEYDTSHPDYGWRWWKHTGFRALTLHETEEAFFSIGQKLNHPERHKNTILLYC